MRSRSRWLIIGLLLLIWQAQAIEGRYVIYGNPLSPALALAEFEVWSGEQNLTAGHAEMFTQDYLYKPYRWGVKELVDGKKDPEGRHVELSGGSASTYSDTASGYPSFEVDLGKSVPVDRIVIYRSRYTMKAYQDAGWRYLLVLNEQRQIVSWEVFNVYEKPHPANKGIWTFEPKPAEGVPAGKVVPQRSRSWLSEAEFIRDFLGKPVVDQVSELSDADRARLARFKHRDDPDAIRQLGEAFFRVVELDRAGLEQVKALVEKEQYAAALEAFKAPYFKTIGRLAGQASFEYSWGYDPDSRDTMRVRDLCNHVYGDKKALTVTRFTPGLMPPAKFEYPFQMRPLLVAYSGTGDANLLKQWEAMTDDWAMGFQDAADKDPALREHFVLIGGVITRNLQDLAEAANSRPELVEELSGATLARFMMPILEETPVSMWRVWRKCVFNHTFNATGGGYEVAKLLADFKAGTRLEREFRQQTLRLHTLSQYRDGPMVEVCDEGHFIFNYLTPARIYGSLCVEQPDWFTPAREAYMLDALRQAELAAIRHTSPSGVGARWSWNRESNYPTMRGERFNPEPQKLERGEPVPESDLCSFLQRTSVMQEDEVRAVADRVYGWGAALDTLDTKQIRELNLKNIEDRYHEPPSIVSDWLPYTGSYYFRGGWERSASLLHMLCTGAPNSTDGGGNLGIYKAWERFGPTAYRFQDYATLLLSTFATQIDEQMPCPQYGRYPSGSKQDVFTQAIEKPQPRRWYTDDTLDFGEAVFSGIYHNIYRWRLQENDQWVVKYEDDAREIPGVTTTRQIVQVRPARLFLQIERVTYASEDETHTNRIPTTLVLTEPGPETKQEFSNDQLTIDEKTRTLKTRNPGNPGVTLAWCGQPEMTFTPYTTQGTETMFWPHPLELKVDPEKDAVLNQDGWGNGYESLNGRRRTSARAVMSSWTATGESVVIGALFANEPGKEAMRRVTDISTDTAAGVYADDANGGGTTLLVARRAPAELTVGAISFSGEALLVTRTRRNATTVMVLGGNQVTIAGKPVMLPTHDSVFDLVDNAAVNIRPIRKPLNPPTIGPAVNTFTETATVTLTTDSPDAEIRYTTELPASRLKAFREEARKLLAGRTTINIAAERLALRELDGVEWKLYTGPFTIDKDTLVRARTFRKGVTKVPMLKTAGDDVSMVSYGFFHQRETLPSQRSFLRGTSPGLTYDYLEGRWFALWTYTDILPAKKTGVTETLLDVSMRQTDGPFAVRYHGLIDIPATGVYSFYGPDEFVNKTCEPGYDLRVYIDGEEWDLGTTWHGLGIWSVPLEKGLHAFKVTFADARAKDLEHQRVDLWRDYPYPQTTWKGVVPTLEISGPNLTRQPLPNAWLQH